MSWKSFNDLFRSSHPESPFKVFLEILQNWQENNCVRVSFLIKLQVSVLRPATLLKKRLWHRCSPLNFAKFLRTPFIIDEKLRSRTFFDEFLLFHLSIWFYYSIRRGNFIKGFLFKELRSVVPWEIISK